MVVVVPAANLRLKSMLFSASNKTVCSLRYDFHVNHCVQGVKIQTSVSVNFISVHILLFSYIIS